MTITPETIELLKRLEAAADVGPWDSDYVATEGSYGTGEDTHEGYDEFIVYNAKGDPIFSTENAEGGTIEVEYDEDGFKNAWNENSRRNIEFCKAARNHLRGLIEAAERLFEARRIYEEQSIEITSLRTQLADAKAEIERLKGNANV